MIYIVWILDRLQLEPELKAFKKKKDAKKYLDEIESEETLNGYGLKCGMWEVPYASSQSKICKNISIYCS
tara:strand:+ start:1010 stop:1219 length:210 start_codon:yes stop_codon:yes gene_type:complete